MASRSEVSSEDLLDITTLESLAHLGERRGRDLLGQLFDLFADQGPKSIKTLRQALEAGDAVTVQETAHSLKGSYRSLGTLRLAGISKELEDLGRAATLDGAEGWVDDLEQAFAATRKALQAFVEERRSQGA